MRAGFYWPKLFAQVGAKVRICIPCQIFAGKQRLASLPLVPVSIEAPFLQWGLDFIGEIVPYSINKHRWILTTTDYFTKWVEAFPFKHTTDIVVIKLKKTFCPDFVAQDKLLQIMLKLSVVSK